MKLTIEAEDLVESLNGEYWKQHPTIGNVFCSNLGRVKFLDVDCKIRLRKQTKGSDRRMNVKFKNSIRKNKSYSVHRLIAETFIPNPLAKQQVNHIDGNPSNNCVLNLEWATQQENWEHAIRNNLLRVGVRNSSGKLNEVWVCQILALCRKTTLKNSAIGAMYGITSESTIQDIYRARNWKQINIKDYVKYRLGQTSNPSDMIDNPRKGFTRRHITKSC